MRYANGVTPGRFPECGNIKHDGYCTRVSCRFSVPKCPECGGDAPRGICTNCRKRGQ